MAAQLTLEHCDWVRIAVEYLLQLRWCQELIRSAIGAEAPLFCALSLISSCCLGDYNDKRCIRLAVAVECLVIQPLPYPPSPAHQRQLGRHTLSTHPAHRGLRSLVTRRTKLVSLVNVSNMLGSILPVATVREIIEA